ncbi:MAG: hypothetical protein WBP55_11905 [Solirubrobacterales bacterium]
MSPTGIIVIASAILVQTGMMGAYISMSRQSKREADAQSECHKNLKTNQFQR